MLNQSSRHLQNAKREAEQKEVARMLEQGVITPSTSPWASPTVLVQHNDGRYRFCCDYRLLNLSSKKDSYPLPRIEDCIHSLGGAKLFCTMDLQAGYWQVEMDPKDREKTAFVTRSGLHEWTVMPFGLCNAPSVFERLMETVLKGLQWEDCLYFHDDNCLGDSHLFQTKANFLGHVISADGVHTQPEKIEAVKEWPTPKCRKDVLRILGLVNYYRRFVENFSKIAKPLTRLTSELVEFQWSSKADEAFMS